MERTPEEEAAWAANLVKHAQQLHAKYVEAGVYDQVPQTMSKTAAPMPHTAIPSNPWSQDAFDPFHGPGGAHRPRRRPGQVPDSRLLFDVQKDMLKAIRELREGNSDAALTQIENGYKLINRYLKQYVPVHNDDLRQDIV
jgi:hypothetical protein